MHLLWTYGFSIFSAIFWVKVLSLGLIFYFINEYKSKQYYYYYNFGISKLKLWSTCMAVDIALFVLCLTLINLLK
jgi:hypothetical protein